MSSSAVTSQGLKVYIGDTGSPQNHTAIPEITSVSGPNGQANLIDVTDLDSTGKEYKVGLKDEGEISLSLSYIPTNAVHASLRSAFSARTLKSFRIEFADTTTTTWDFSGYVSGFSINNAVDDVTKAEVTLKITGAITEGT